MRIAVTGTGYVGLVTGVSLAEVGHRVTCIDIDEAKVSDMQKGISPIYEPSLSEMMKRNIENSRLTFTADHAVGYRDANVIYIAVGTPEDEDGTANLTFINQAAKDIAEHANRDIIVVTKSTVPVGTNDRLLQLINENLVEKVRVDIVSNPEFLREGSALHDAFHGDRIVIGSDSEHAANVIEEINQPFGVPIYKTDVRSAEMIKYASNAFLATKISFINEIANICERTDADIRDVAAGMGMDTRIGNKFLNAGIGFGGSCFPKDAKALIQIGEEADYDFKLLKSVVEVNTNQQLLPVEKLKEILPTLWNKRIAVLGLAFKPNTDDMREAASIMVTEQLIEQGAEVIGYDPVAMNNAKALLSDQMLYAESAEEAVKDCDAALILTEWDEIKNIDLSHLEATMNYPLLIDGRNCIPLERVGDYQIDYYSIGRPPVTKWKEKSERA